MLVSLRLLATTSSLYGRKIQHLNIFYAMIEHRSQKILKTLQSTLANADITYNCNPTTLNFKKIKINELVDREMNSPTKHADTHFHSQQPNRRSIDQSINESTKPQETRITKTDKNQAKKK